MKDRNYTKVGRGSNLVFLHGWEDDRRTWFKVADFLKKDYTCWLVDLPYFGKSDVKLQDLSVIGYEKWLEHFLADNHIKKTHVLGHSFGARIAVVCASKSKKVDKLIIYAIPSFKKARNASLFKKASSITGLKNVPVLSNFLRSDDYKNAQGIKKEIFLKAVTFDYTKVLRVISNSTLIIWGENDAETSLNWAREVNGLLKNSELYVVPNATHFVHLEKPLLFASKVKEFLQNK